MPLMDDGFVSAPSSPVWNPEGKYDIENIGVPTDIEFDMDPELVRHGADPQLDKAIEVVLEELEKNPVPQPKRPPFSNYHSQAGSPVAATARAPRRAIKPVCDN